MIKIQALHLLAMIFAFGRLIELFGVDRITENLRKSFPSYLWQCPRCLSVWAGISATGLFIYYPWANWPLALSWLYIAWRDAKAAQQGRVLRVSIINGRMQWHNELNVQELMALVNAITVITEPDEAKESTSSVS